MSYRNLISSPEAITLCPQPRSIAQALWQRHTLCFMVPLFFHHLSSSTAAPCPEHCHLPWVQSALYFVLSKSRSSPKMAVGILPVGKYTVYTIYKLLKSLHLFILHPSFFGYQNTPKHLYRQLNTIFFSHIYKYLQLYSQYNHCPFILIFYINIGPHILFFYLWCLIYGRYPSCFSIVPLATHPCVVGCICCPMFSTICWRPVLTSITLTRVGA